MQRSRTLKMARDSRDAARTGAWLRAPLTNVYNVLWRRLLEHVTGSRLFICKFVLYNHFAHVTDKNGSNATSIWLVSMYSPRNLHGSKRAQGSVKNCNYKESQMPNRTDIT